MSYRVKKTTPSPRSGSARRALYDACSRTNLPSSALCPLNQAPPEPHLVLQLLPAALYCAAQAALLGLLLISRLSVTDGNLGFVCWGGTGVAHQTLWNSGFALKRWLLHGGAQATARSSLHQCLGMENVWGPELLQAQMKYCLRSWRNIWPKGEIT